MPQQHQDCQLHSSSSHHERTYRLSSQEFHESIKTVSFISAPSIMTELTNCQAMNSPRASSQLHSSSSHHERTHRLSSQEFPKSIKTVSFISAPTTMRELTDCQAKNSPRASRLSALFQLQPPWENLHSVKPRIPQEHQDCQLHSSPSHYERTYILLSQEFPKTIKTVSFIPAPATMRTHRLSNQEFPKTIKTISFIVVPATMRELTDCQAKNSTKALRLSASFQLWPPWENLQTVKPRIPQKH